MNLCSRSRRALETEDRYQKYRPPEGSIDERYEQGNWKIPDANSPVRRPTLNNAWSKSEEGHLLSDFYTFSKPSQKMWFQIQLRKNNKPFSGKMGPYNMLNTSVYQMLLTYLMPLNAGSSLIRVYKRAPQRHVEFRHRP